MKMKFLLLLLCAVDLSQGLRPFLYYNYISVADTADGMNFLTGDLNVSGDFATSPVSNSAFEFDHEWYVSKQEFRYLDREFVKRNTRFFIWTR